MECWGEWVMKWWDDKLMNLPGGSLIISCRICLGWKTHNYGTWWQPCFFHNQNKSKGRSRKICFLFQIWQILMSEPRCFFEIVLGQLVMCNSHYRDAPGIFRERVRFCNFWYITGLAGSMRPKSMTIWPVQPLHRVFRVCLQNGRSCMNFGIELVDSQNCEF